MDMMERVVIGLQNLRETIKTATQYTFTFGDIRAKNVKRIDNTLALLKEQEGIIKSLESDLSDCKAVIAERSNVVRCKDCEYSLFIEGMVLPGHIVCTKPFTERWQAVKPNNWFCADGKLPE